MDISMDTHVRVYHVRVYLRPKEKSNYLHGIYVRCITLYVYKGMYIHVYRYPYICIYVFISI